MLVSNDTLLVGKCVAEDDVGAEVILGEEEEDVVDEFIGVSS